MKIGSYHFKFPLAKRRTAKKHRELLGQLTYGLEQHGIDCFIDVGANEGQTALGIRRWGYAGEIHSIEPVKECHDRIVQLSRKDPKWRVLDRMALGDEDGMTDVIVRRGSDLSSLTAATDHLKQAFSDADATGTETVPLRRLDTVYRDPPKGRRLFLKIDAQGYDFRVLQGASGIMDCLQGIAIEASLVPLYEQETLYMEVLAFLHGLGMQPYILAQRTFSKRTYRQLQIDVVFFRE